MSLLTDSESGEVSGQKLLRKHAAPSGYNHQREGPVSDTLITRQIIRNITDPDPQPRWFLITNKNIVRRSKDTILHFDFKFPDKPHPILVIALTSALPGKRYLCHVRSASRATAIDHYQHTRCIRSCVLNKDGYIDDKWMWSVPADLCNTVTFSCEEPIDSYVFDSLDEYNFGSPL